MPSELHGLAARSLVTLQVGSKILAGTSQLFQVSRTCLRQTYVYLASCMAGPLPMAEYFSEFAGGRSLLRFDYDPELPAADLPLGAPCAVPWQSSRRTFREQG